MKRFLMILALASLFSLTALGLGGSIQAPQLGFPEGTSAKTIEEVLSFLKHEVAFIDGSFINEFSTQRYGGSMERITALVSRLHAAGFTLEIAFAELEEDRVAFMISQVAGARQTTITINTASPELRWRDLRIHVPAAADENRRVHD